MASSPPAEAPMATMGHGFEPFGSAGGRAVLAGAFLFLVLSFGGSSALGLGGVEVPFFVSAFFLVESGLDFIVQNLAGRLVATSLVSKPWNESLLDRVSAAKTGQEVCLVNIGKLREEIIICFAGG